jgi:hypothetical protein
MASGRQWQRVEWQVSPRAKRAPGARSSRRPGRGRACHWVLVFICACSITAVSVCISEHVRWRRALNGRLARGYAGPAGRRPRPRLARATLSLSQIHTIIAVVEHVQMDIGIQRPTRPRLRSPAPPYPASSWDTSAPAVRMLWNKTLRGVSLNKTLHGVSLNKTLHGPSLNKTLHGPSRRASPNSDQPCEKRTHLRSLASAAGLSWR